MNDTTKKPVKLRRLAQRKGKRADAAREVLEAARRLHGMVADLHRKSAEMLREEIERIYIVEVVDCDLRHEDDETCLSDVEILDGVQRIVEIYHDLPMASEEELKNRAWPSEEGETDAA